MLNKCAKFHGDSPSGYKVKLNLARAIEISETADFVYNLETLYKQATSVPHLTNFSFEFFMPFSHKIPLYFFYTMAQKSQKRPKTQIKGSCFKVPQKVK